MNKCCDEKYICKSDYDCCCPYKKRDCMCDCCVKPFEYILSQFKLGDELNVYLDFFGVPIVGTFVCIKDSILTIKCDYDFETEIHKISLCHITRINSERLNPDIPEPIKLLPPPEKPRKCECSCCEEPIRKCLQCACGVTISFILMDLDQAFRCKILKVGEGIAITKCEPDVTDCPYNAIALCRVVDTIFITHV